MAESIRAVDPAEAERLFEAMPSRPLPGTLHPRYVVADARRTDGLQPLFVHYQRGAGSWLHGLHTSRIAGTPWQDASSPYGYGGPVASSADPDFLQAAWTAYREWMRQAGCIVEYLRFHPLRANEAGYTGVVQDNRQVVSVDLSPADFAAGYSVRTRQAVRKAERAGLAYRELPFATAVAGFGAFHRAAMQAMGTDSFYLFGDAYFDAIAAVPEAKLGLCESDGAWAAAALFLDHGGVREYHLAASSEVGRQLGAASLLLHRAAESARAAGLRQLYLGGGTDTRADNALLFFKAGFSPRRLAYRTGSTVIDPEAYAALERMLPAQRAAHPHWPIFHRKV